MKLAVVCTYAPDSGQGVVGSCSRLVRGLAEAGHAVHVISKAPANDEERTIRQGELTIHEIRAAGGRVPGLWRLQSWLEGVVPLFRLRYSWRVRQVLLALIETEGVEVVMSPEWNAEAFWFAWRRPPVPLVVSVHGGTWVLRRFDGQRSLATWILDLMERALVRRADGRVAVSRMMARGASQRYGVPVRAFDIIHNGTELPAAKQAEGASEAQPSAPRILYVGRLERLKGLRILARALSIVVQYVPDVQIDLVGEDRPWNGSFEMTSEYLKRVLSPGLWSRIHLHGPVPRSELTNRYRQSTVCVFPSLFESFGNVIAEAMAAGCAVVTTTRTGIAELIEHGRDGWLVPPEHHLALAEALVVLLSHHDLRRQMARYARGKVERSVPPSEWVSRYVRVLEGATQAVGRAHPRAARTIRPAIAGPRS